MIIFGDIHTNSTISDKLNESIMSIANKNPGEDILFVGDFVYHFNYDRTALLHFFETILSLYHQGRTIYLVAGNHDWLQTHFVYEEARKAFSLLNQHTPNKIHFITTPQLFEIHNQKTLFLPHTIHKDQLKTILEERSNISPEKLITPQLQPIRELSQQLIESKNSGEQLSGYINAIACQAFRTNQIDSIVHHYYVAEQEFPGVQANFSFKDGAIHKIFCSLPNCITISGHIHKAFQRENYICIGSHRYTSPLEINHDKRYATRHGEKTFNFFPVRINPYISFEQENIQGTFNENSLQNTINNITNQHKETLSKGNNTIIFHEGEYPEIKNCKLTILSNTLQYQELENFIDKNLLQKLGDTKIKKVSASTQDSLHSLSTANKDLKDSLLDRKTILREHIEQRFKENSEMYLDILREMKIF